MTENTIELLDGSELVGVPRTTESDEKWPDKAVQDAEAELFVRNAHFLLANAKRILADSRLFLAPVNIQSGMAYSGALPKPCLGGYLEWWISEPCATKRDNGRLELVYCISGSPLSGRNCSMGVAADGSRSPCATASLLKMASTFRDAMRRYEEPRRKFAAYSLEEALRVLKGEDSQFGNSVAKIALERRIADLEEKVGVLEAKLAREEKKSRDLSKGLVRAVVRERPEEVCAALAEADAAVAAGTPAAKKGAWYRPVTMLFRAFAKRERVELSAPSKKVLLEELAKSGSQQESCIRTRAADRS